MCSCSVDECGVIFLLRILLICLPDVWSSHYIVCNNASLARHTAGSADKRNSTTFGSLRYLPRPTATARPSWGYVAVSICRPPTSYSTRRMRTELGGMTKSAAGCNNVVHCLESDEDELVSPTRDSWEVERERESEQTMHHGNTQLRREELQLYIRRWSNKSTSFDWSTESVTTWIGDVRGQCADKGGGWVNL